MQRHITRGAAAGSGLIFHIFAQDSGSTTGAGKASIAFGSWSCRYIRSGEAISGAITPEDITTIGTYAAPTANTNIRIKAVDNTNMIGVYEVQIHSDWVNATNSCQSLTIFLTASGAAPIPIQIPLIAANVQDSVRMGLTALPNAAADAAGGLPISDAGGLDLDTKLANTNEVTAARMAALTDWIDGGRLDLILDARASQTSVDDLPTNAELATALAAADDAVLAAIAALNNLSEASIRTALGMATGNLDTQLGDLPTNAELAVALAAADDAVLAQIALVKVKSDLIPAAPAAVGDIPTAVQVADAILLRDWTAIAGAVPARSALNAFRAIRNKWAVAAGVLTVTKEDDLTTAWTSVLSTDAAADPIIASDPS